MMIGGREWNPRDEGGRTGTTPTSTPPPVPPSLPRLPPMNALETWPYSILPDCMRSLPCTSNRCRRCRLLRARLQHALVPPKQVKSICLPEMTADARCHLAGLAVGSLAFAARKWLLQEDDWSLLNLRCIFFLSLFCFCFFLGRLAMIGTGENIFGFIETRLRLGESNSVCFFSYASGFFYPSHLLSRNFVFVSFGCGPLDHGWTAQGGLVDRQMTCSLSPF